MPGKDNLILTLLSYAVSPTIAAFLSGYLVSRWKSREDHLDKRFDELCAVISETANLGSEYWLHKANDPGMLLTEAKISGKMILIASLRVALSEAISCESRVEIERAESRFLREMTGGNFGVHNRDADRNRILSCQSVGATFIGVIRNARHRDLRGWRRRA